MPPQMEPICLLTHTHIHTHLNDEPSNENGAVRRWEMGAGLGSVDGGGPERRGGAGGLG